MDKIRNIDSICPYAADQDSCIVPELPVLDDVRCGLLTSDSVSYMQCPWRQFEFSASSGCYESCLHSGVVISRKSIRPNGLFNMIQEASPEEQSKWRLQVTVQQLTRSWAVSKARVTEEVCCFPSEHSVQQGLRHREFVPSFGVLYCSVETAWEASER